MWWRKQHPQHNRRNPPATREHEKNIDHSGGYRLNFRSHDKNKFTRTSLDGFVLVFFGVIVLIFGQCVCSRQTGSKKSGSDCAEHQGWVNGLECRQVDHVFLSSMLYYDKSLSFEKRRLSCSRIQILLCTFFLVRFVFQNNIHNP